MVGFFSVSEESPRDRCFGACVTLPPRHRTRNSTPEVCGPTYAAASTRSMNAFSMEGGCHSTGSVQRGLSSCPWTYVCHSLLFVHSIGHENKSSRALSP